MKKMMMRPFYLVCYSYIFLVASFSQSNDAKSNHYLIAGGVVEHLGSVQFIEAAAVTFFDFTCPLEVLENIQVLINRTKEHIDDIEYMQTHPSMHIDSATTKLLRIFKNDWEFNLSKLKSVEEHPWVANAQKNDAYNFKELPNFEQKLLENSYLPILRTFELIMVNVFDYQSRNSTTMKKGTSFSFYDNRHKEDIDILNEIIDETLTMNKEVLEIPQAEKTSSIWDPLGELSIIYDRIKENNVFNSYSNSILKIAEEINSLMSEIESNNVIKIPSIPYKTFKAIDEYAQKQLSTDPIVPVTENSLPEFVKHASFLKGPGDYHVFMLTPYVSHMNRLYRILPFPTLPFPNSEKRVTLNINREDIFVVPPVGAITSIPEDHLSKCKSIGNGKQGTQYACLKPRYPKPADGCVSDLLLEKEANSCMYSIYPSNDIYHEQFDHQIYISLPSNVTGHYYCKSSAIKPFRSVTVASVLCGIRIKETIINEPSFVPPNSQHQSQELAYPEPPTISQSQIIGYKVPSSNTALTVSLSVVICLTVICIACYLYRKFCIGNK